MAADPIDRAHAAVRIRPARSDDWLAMWDIIRPVFRAGDTYGVATDIDEADARRHWMQLPEASFVALADDGRMLGTYYLKPNHGGPGAHVANCGYIVAEAARGRGVASAMCAHSQREAVTRGYRAMQYNLVASTNTAAVRLWQQHGFDAVGRLPGAFRHPRKGLVDAFVMYKTLDTPPTAE